MDDQQAIDRGDQPRQDQDEALAPSTNRESETIDAQQVGPDSFERSPNDELILALLAAGLSHDQVATQCSISSKTIQRRLRDPAFAADVTERRRQRVATTALRLVNLGDDAVGVMSDLLAAESDSVRLQAAKSVLDLGGRYHRADLLERELADQITDLKRILDELLGESEGGP